MLANGPGYAQAVVGRRPSADFINDNERIWSSRAQHAVNFKHFAHESRNPFKLLVRGPDSRYDGVNYGYLGVFAGHEAADVRQQAADGDLSEVGALSPHIWPRDNVQTGAF